MNGLDLLVEEIVALLLVHFALNLVLNVVAEFEFLEFEGKKAQQLHSTLFEVVNRQQFHLVGRFQRNVRRHKVDEESRACNVFDGKHGIRLHFGALRYKFTRFILDRCNEGVKFRVAFFRENSVNHLVGSGKKLVGTVAGEFYTLQRMYQTGDTSVGQLIKFFNFYDSANAVHIVVCGFVDGGIFLRNGGNEQILAVSLFDEFHRFFAVGLNRHNYLWEKRIVAQWKNVNLFADGLIPIYVERRVGVGQLNHCCHTVGTVHHNPNSSRLFVFFHLNG